MESQNLWNIVGGVGGAVAAAGAAIVSWIWRRLYKEIDDLRASIAEFQAGEFRDHVLREERMFADAMTRAEAQNRELQAQIRELLERLHRMELKVVAAIGLSKRRDEGQPSGPGGL